MRIPFFPVSTKKVSESGVLLPSQLRGAHQFIQETHPVPSSRPPQLWRNPPGNKKTIHHFRVSGCAGNVDLKISANKKNKTKICHRKTFRESIQLLAFPQRFNTNPNWDLCKLEAGGLKLGAKNLVFFSEAGKHVRFIHVHYEHVSCWNLLLLSVHTCWLNMYEIYWIMTFLKRFQGLIGKAKEIRNGNLSFSWLPRWYPFASVKIQGVLIHT